jgi:hypothetical protein
MKILWTNSTLSGLGDRLIDLFLLAAFARSCNAILYVVWQNCCELNSLQKKTWPKSRLEGYKIENLSQYFKFPKNIVFCTEISIQKYCRDKRNIQFNDYLGGIYTASSFYSKFYSKYKKNENFNLLGFENAFRETLNDFQPKHKLLKKFESQVFPDISVDLRRGDKVTLKPDIFSVSHEEQFNLNTVTELCINELSDSNLSIKTIYFCSDDSNLLYRFRKKYSSIRNLNLITMPQNTKGFEKTYVDLWMLASSKKIILSQRHSNFSIFASYLKNARLIYFYFDNRLITNNNFLNKQIYTNNYVKVRPFGFKQCILSFFQKNYTGNSVKNVIYHNQGWTDIINCLGLVTYYTYRYNNLILIVREDSSDLINFYFKDKKIQIHYFKFDDLNRNYKKVLAKYNTSKFFFHGQWDRFRTDQYKRSFNKKNDVFFVNNFYEAYDINYTKRIKNFSFSRDLSAENNAYKRFIKKNGVNYILTHETNDVKLTVIKLNLPEINLDNSTRIFFDFITIMQNAKAMYLIDSVWAAFAYQLDAKYKLFKNIQITVECKRGYKDMFMSPYILPNWEVI